MPNNVYVCFPGGRHKAITLSYDDGKTSDRRLVETMNAHGLRGTFHVNSALIGTEGRLSRDETATLYAGHEVAVHTAHHPTIARCPNELIVEEVASDRAALEAIVGYPVRGMSYPNGSYTKGIKEMLPFLGIEYSRVVPTSHGGFGMPEDLYEWEGTCHHNDRLLDHARAFLDLTKTQYLYLMYVWGHSYEFEAQDNWGVIEDFCSLVGGHPEIWYATNIEIVDYMNAFSRLRFSARCDFVQNPSAASVWISVGTSIVEVPGGAQVSLPR